MKLLLSILPLFAALIDTNAEVLNNFDNCKNFFYNEKIPNGFQDIAKADLFDRNDFPDGIDVKDLASPAYICQTYEDTYSFATLYDRGRLMPLYSAYIMNAVPNKDPTECKRIKAFNLEPELVYRAVGKNMMLTKDTKPLLDQYNKAKKIDESKPKNRVSYLLQTSQAIDADYTNSGYDRGHLNPCGHQTKTPSGHKATFTLTNVVPMEPSINKKIWSQYEVEMIKTSEKCAHMYVITGIVPGNVPVKEGKRLTAPTHVWNAYCCVDNNGKPIMSGAALVENVEGKEKQKFDNVVDFQAELKNLLGVSQNIELFEGDCKPQNVQ